MDHSKATGTPHPNTPTSRTNRSGLARNSANLSLSRLGFMKEGIGDMKSAISATHVILQGRQNSTQSLFDCEYFFKSQRIALDGCGSMAVAGSGPSGAPESKTTRPVIRLAFLLK